MVESESYYCPDCGYSAVNYTSLYKHRIKHCPKTDWRQKNELETYMRVMSCDITKKSFLNQDLPDKPRKPSEIILDAVIDDMKQEPKESCLISKETKCTKVVQKETLPLSKETREEKLERELKKKTLEAKKRLDTKQALEAKQALQAKQFREAKKKAAIQARIEGKARAKLKARALAEALAKAKAKKAAETKAQAQFKATHLKEGLEIKLKPDFEQKLSQEGLGFFQQLKQEVYNFILESYPSNRAFNLGRLRGELGYSSDDASARVFIARVLRELTKEGAVERVGTRVWRVKRDIED